VAGDLSWHRADFPALAQSVRGRPLVYLDNASTTPKPRAVLDATLRMLAAESANVHRGVHALSEAATASFEGARARVAAFLGAAADEIVWTRGTTEAVNLVAQTWGRQAVGPGDAIVVTELEHHSNLVPWQMLCRERGAELRVLPVSDAGTLELGALPALLAGRVRLVALAHVSNVLGVENPVAEVAAAAHAAGALVLVDGAQAVGHLPVDVSALGCDFYALSGHKMLGPTGAGVLWGRRALLEAMPPWHGGGEMVLSVRLDGATYREPPHRFEAGTPDIAGAVGVGAAAAYLDEVGRPAIAAREGELARAVARRLADVPGLRFVGDPAARRAPIFAFNLGEHHPHDVATIVDRAGVAVRSGHHCAEPLHRRFGLRASVRASLGFYNSEAEIEALAAALAEAAEVLA
jgi:cysteine desulfurase/selenocysteine lyase